MTAAVHIREAETGDLVQLLELYTHLHDNPLPGVDAGLKALWDGILQDANHHILLGLVDARLVTSCVVVVVPNLTQRQRPYALVENVITHPAYRGRGFASAVLAAARDIARRCGCYKIMLMTGSKLESTWRLYERAGYNRIDKTAFIQWLD